MSLTLTITNVESLENGSSTRLRLDRHGAVIGRSPQADWCLPDPQHYISSSHCEIDFKDGAYLLVDKSTNGSFLNGAQARMTSPHVVKDGDQVLIGPYQVSLKLDGADAPPARDTAAEKPSWTGWDSHAGGPAPATALSAWDRPEARSAISGMGAMSGNWSTPVAAAPIAAAPPPPEPAPVSGWGAPAPASPGASSWGAAPSPAPRGAPADSWDAPSPAPAQASDGWGAPARAPSAWDQPAAAALAPSDWSSPVVAPPAQPAAADVWGKLAEGNTVDWARSGFGLAPPPVVLAPAPTKDPFGLADPVAPSSVGPALQATPAWGAPAAAPSVPAPTGPGGGEWAAFLTAAGLTPAEVKADPRAAMTAAGDLLRRLIAGMVVMVEARARAKAQLGAQGTALEFDGNNPLKFARSPQKALAQLLGAPERGFMPADRAVEDAFRDLQAHQMATLAAMQGALAATLARFSPQSIRERAETRGLLSKILPAARDAEMWKVYEREFEGVARGSDEAFMDVFAKEFKNAYETAANDMKRKS